jgi:trans-aconitate methyltransferase
METAMSFNPNQLLNNPAGLLAVKGLNAALAPPAPQPPRPPAAPAEPEPYDRTLYENAFSRLGMMSLANVADLGCGCGNFTGIMVSRNQRPEVYIGVDISHAKIQAAKACYPGWSFVYGDFASPQVIPLYERFDAYLMLNVMDVLEDELALLDIVPAGKPVLFSIPRFAKEGSLRYYGDVASVRERYSNHLSVKSVGRLNLGADPYYMVQGVRW